MPGSIKDHLALIASDPERTRQCALGSVVTSMSTCRGYGEIFWAIVMLYLVQMMNNLTRTE